MTRGSTKRALEMLRLLHLLALAVLTVLVAGAPMPKRDVVSVAAAVARPAPAAAPAARRASALPAFHHWQAGVVRPLRTIEDRLAVGAGLEGDDDAAPDLANELAAAFTSASFPREPGRPSPSEPPIDTLRFAIGRGLPRAPPA
jgi:hypothetical protein